MLLGQFNEDARGRWYINVVVDAAIRRCLGQSVVGIGLGLKDVATCSDGEKLENSHFYRRMEERLAIAQRSRNKQRTRAIHAKSKNRRKDALHKCSRHLANRYGEIVVGDVCSQKLARTKIAKSVLDAGWAS